MRLDHVQKAIEVEEIEVEEIEVEEDKVVDHAPTKRRPKVRPDCDRRAIVSIWRYG